MHSNVLPEDAFTILMDGDIDGNEIRMRVEAAKYLIDEGNYDMMEVAHQCGYENEVTFRRAFVKHAGVTPQKYIKSQKMGEKRS